MTLSRRAVLLAALSTLLAVLPACQNGSIWPFGDDKPLHATRAELTRQSEAQVDQEAVNQKLSINLASGVAVLQDTDGRSYTLQFDNDTLAQINATFDSGKWQVGCKKPSAKDAGAMHYSVVAYKGDDKVGHKACWSQTNRRKDSQALDMLVATFDQAHRVAHPISEKVDITR